MIVLALTAALVAPYFIDWTSYRAEFEREASRILGRDVEVRGTASARLLPFPSVTFTDVVVTSSDGERAMTVDTFSMDAELAPFLSGEVLIFDMRLQRPEVTVVIDEDGKLDWSVRPETQIDLQSITVENMTIADGRIRVQNRAGGREHVIAGIDAQVSARTLAGPWRASGQMVIDDVVTALTLNIGTAEPGQPLRVRMRAEPLAYPVTIETEGTAAVEAETGKVGYQGQFRLNQFAETADGERQGPAVHRVSGTFHADHEQIVADDFRLETGPLDDPYTADGNAMITIGAEPRFRIVAEGVQFRVDEAQGGAARLEDRIAALRGFIDRLPKPTIPGSIQLALPAVLAGDTTIRDVRLRAEPSEAGWRIAALNATLPGRTALEASGELVTGEELGFSGSLILAINQPSGFAAWLSRDVDEAIRRLPAAGFSADVELGERRQSFRDLELVLGASVFRGEIDNRQPEDARPSMALRLEGEGLDVDGMSAFASLFVSGSGQNRLEDHDLDFEIRAEEVRMAGVNAQSLDTAFRFRDGLLEIDRLEAMGLEGADVSASGSVRDLAGTPRGGIEARVNSADLRRLITLAAERLPDSRLVAEIVARVDAYPDLARDADLAISVTSAAGERGAIALTASAEGRIGGNEVALRAASPDWTGDISNSALRATLTARSDDAADLFSLVGLPGELPGFAGPAQAEMLLDGVLGLGAAARMTMSGDDSRAHFEGEMRLARDGFSAKGRARLQSGDLGPWLMTAAVPVPTFDASIPTELRAEIDYSTGLLVLTDMEGEVAGTRISGELNAEMRDGLPHLSGEAYLSSIDMMLATEMLFGAEAHVGNGAVWPTAPFRPNAVMPFTSDVALSVDQIHFGNGMRLGQSRMGLRLGRSALTVADLDASAHGGRLSGLGELRNEAGEGLFSAQIRLEDADAGRLMPWTGIGGVASATASLSATGKSFDAMMAALSGSGTARVTGLSIAGIAPDALPALLEAADALGHEIDAEMAQGFAPDIVRAGRLEAEEAEFAFTVAGGTLRAPPIQIAARGARVGAEVAVDIGRWTAQADATVQYDAGADSLVGSDPAVRLIARGPIGDIEVTTDTDPLARFLTQRALEREQQRVEDMQAGLLEQQRIRREVRYFASLRQGRLDQEEERRQAEVEAQRMMEEEMRRRAEAEEQRRIEAERRQAEEEARRAADEEARLRAQQEAEIRLEQERQRVEEARRRAEEEARAEEERRRQLETDIETILRQQESRMDGLEEVGRAPLAPLPPAPETQRRDTGLPGVSGMFRPERLSPEGFLGGN